MLLSNLTSTDSMPVSSDAEISMSVNPVTVLPFEGERISTSGGAVSGGVGVGVYVT